MRAIVRDMPREDGRRCEGPKSARRFAVAPEGPPDIVTSLAGATGPCCAPFLAGGPSGAITVGQSRSKRL